MLKGLECGNFYPSVRHKEEKVETELAFRRMTVRINIYLFALALMLQEDGLDNRI